MFESELQIVPEVWPGGTLNPRLQSVWQVSVYKGQGLVPQVGTRRETLLPDELYLRELMALDLGSPGDVAAFASAYGLLRVSGTRATAYGWAAIRWHLESPADYASQLRVRLLNLEAFEGEEGDADGEERAALRAVLASLQLEKQGRLGSVVSMDEFRFVARQLRDMVRVWQANTRSIPIGGALEAWESSAEVPEDLEAAVSWMLDCLNRGLEAYQAQVTVSGAPVRPGGPFSALCLQMYNHIAENATYRRCASERCNRAFVRRRGGEQHWTTDSLRFCSPECARAEASRVYRAKMGRARNLLDQGLSEAQVAVRMDEPVARVHGWKMAIDKRRKGGQA